MDRVIFVVFGDADTKIYEEELPKYFPIGSSTPVKSETLTTSATPMIRSFSKAKKSNKINKFDNSMILQLLTSTRPIYC